MSTTTLADLKTVICAENRCWRVGKLGDAGVIANVGSHWRILRLDFHFSACVPEKHRQGGLCDGVAAYPQDTNNGLRLLELKQSLDDAPSALPQLAKGGAVVAERLTDGLRGVDLTAEIHVKHAPHQTLRYQNEIRIGKRKVEVVAIRQGQPV